MNFPWRRILPLGIRYVNSRCMRRCNRQIFRSPRCTNSRKSSCTPRALQPFTGLPLNWMWPLSVLSVAFLLKVKTQTVCGHAYSSGKSPPVRGVFDLTRLCLPVFNFCARCWVRGARLPCHALAAFATDVGEQISRCTLSDISLVVHRPSPN
jgi:hypothetical protein